MTRAAWGTARFPSFSVSRLPRFQAGTVTRAAAPSLLLSLVLEVYLYFVVVSFFVFPPSHLRVPYRECSVGC